MLPALHPVLRDDTTFVLSLERVGRSGRMSRGQHGQSPLHPMACFEARLRNSERDGEVVAYALRDAVTRPEIGAIRKRL